MHIPERTSVPQGPPTRRLLQVALPGLGGRPPWRQSLPHLPALAAALARGRFVAAPGPPERLWLELFDISGAEEPPVAALTRLADFPQAGPGGAWLRADPVYLHADLERLLLFDAAAIDVTAAEAEALVAALDAHLAEAEGLRLAVGACPTRWYLELPEPPRLRTVSPASAHGRHVGPLLPAGPDAGRWNRIANELQMLLHVHEVNAARAARGVPPVNAVWFWGGGALPSRPAYPPACAWGSDALLRGLAAWLQVPLGEAGAAFPGSALPAVAADDALYVALAADDATAWADALVRCEREWIAPALAALWRGSIEWLVLTTETGVVELTRADLRRFWRRRPLAVSLERLAASGSG